MKKRMIFILLVFMLFVQYVFSQTEVDYDCKTTESHYDKDGNQVGSPQSDGYSHTKSVTVCKTLTIPDPVPFPVDPDSAEDARKLEEYIRKNADKLGVEIDEETGKIKAGRKARIEDSRGFTAEASSPPVGDPVRIATGEFMLDVSDLVIKNDIPFDIKRSYLSNSSGIHSFGKGWVYNFDTRLIHGVNYKADELYEMFKEFNNDFKVIVKDEIVIDDLYSLIKLAKNGLEQSRSNMNFLSNYKQYSKIRLHYDAAVGATQKWLKFYENLKQYKVDYEAVRVIENKVKDGYKSAERGYIYAKANRERNRYTINSSDPSYLSQTGNTTLTYIDEKGKHILYELTSEPGYSSTSKYPDGSINYYPSGVQAIAKDPGAPELYLHPDGSYTLTTKEKTVYRYSYYGQLVKKVDSRGNALNFAYNGRGEMASITDRYGREIKIERDESGRIIRAEDPKGREVSYGYADDYLTSVTDPEGDTIGYRYNSNIVTEIVKPDGSSRKYHYDSLNERYRVATTEDEEGNREYFEYNFTDRYTIYRTDAGIWEKHYYNKKYLTYKIEYLDGSHIYKEYDDNNNMTLYRNEVGNVYRYEYDEHHNVVKKIDPDGRTAIYTYTSANKPATVIDRSGRLTSYQYDGNNNLVKINYPDETTTEYRYNSDNKLVTARDQLGRVTKYSYDRYGYLAFVTDPKGGVTRYTNDILGNRISVKDPAGAVTTFSYNNDNKVVLVEDAIGGREQLFYNNRKDLVKVVDKRGAETNFAYDRIHNMTAMTDALGQLTTFTYRMDGKRLTKRVGYLQTTIYKYNSRGRRVEALQEETGISEEWIYNPAGQLVGHKDGNGNWTEYQYDIVGRLIREQNPDSSAKTFTYTLSGKAATVTDEQGNVSSYSYDRLDRVIEVSYPEELVEQFSYDKKGNLITKVDRRGNRISYGYDALDRRVSVTDQAGNSSYIRYDNRGLVIAEIDRNRAKTSYDYDSLKRLIMKKDALGGVTEYSYDAMDNLTSLKDPLGNQTAYEYDNLNRVISETDALGNKTSYSYNILGKKERMTDSAGNSTIYSFDALGRVTSKRDRTGIIETVSYDGVGNVIAQTDGEDNRTVYSYDNRSHLTKVVSPEGIVKSYSYDSGGNKISFAVGEGPEYSYRYDGLGRVVEETNRKGDSQTYRYDGNDNLVEKTDFAGETTHFGYDKLDRQVKVELPGGEVKLFSYDREGNLLTAENSQSLEKRSYDKLARLVSSSTLNKEGNIEVQTRYSYDKAGNTVSRTLIDGDNKRYHSDYGYDAVYNHVSTTDSEGGTTYLSYDSLRRVVSKQNPNETGTDYSYYEEGRVKSVIHWKNNSKNERERLQSEGYIYNKGGKIVYKIDGRADVTAYSYDRDGRLIKALYPLEHAKTAFSAKEMIESGLRPLKLEIEDDYDDHDEEEEDDDDYEEDDDEIEYYGVGLSLEPEVSTELSTLYDRITECSCKKLKLSEKSYWQESFSYDANSNILTVASPYGKIEHSYDSENLITRKGNRAYSHDKNGNLTKEELAGELKIYSYSSDNRLINLETRIYDVDDDDDDDREWDDDDEEYEDEDDREYVLGGSSYSYDALGRQIVKLSYEYDDDEEEEKEVEDITYSFYQGMNPVFSYSGDYEPHPYKEGVDREELDSQEHLYLNGLIHASLEREEGEFEEDGSLFYFTNPQGSVTLSTEYDEADDEARLTYDAWGTLYYGTLEESNGFGYNGKPFDRISGSYNYGFRDYKISNKQWLTVDPIRDGMNWKTYLGGVADPVNYVDPDGLSAFSFPKAPGPVIVVSEEGRKSTILNPGDIYWGDVDAVVYIDPKTGEIKVLKVNDGVPVTIGRDGRPRAPFNSLGNVMKEIFNELVERGYLKKPKLDLGGHYSEGDDPGGWIEEEKFLLGLADDVDEQIGDKVTKDQYKETVIDLYDALCNN